jgi:putative transposase
MNHETSAYFHFSMLFNAGRPPVLRPMTREIITRRSLPHWYKPGAIHFVTYRLFNTLPLQVLKTLQAKKASLLNQRELGGDLKHHRDTVHKQLFAAYDRYLDQCDGEAWLKVPCIASMVRENLYYHHGRKYHLLAYCIMPNHVHVLLQPMEDNSQAARLPETVAQAARLYSENELGEQTDPGSPLSSIMHSLKSYTAHQANKLLRQHGTFWQAESYDHWVRDEAELQRIVEYIAANPVQAKLVRRPQDWTYCSYQDRMVRDGEPTAWLGLPSTTP